MLSVVMPNVFMLGVVAPQGTKCSHFPPSLILTNKGWTLRVSIEGIAKIARIGTVTKPDRQKTIRTIS